MNITILCKVVDNFGDIGVCYRLARQLKKIEPSNHISLIVQGLDSFHNINNKIDETKSFQVVDDLEVYDWNANDFCFEKFSENDGEKLAIILECFQCGRPEWMEEILFEKKLERTVHIIMIDYLTAEKYAEDFHCLKSLTRSAKVQKVNFMPGFTSKTGGLIIDDGWEALPERNEHGPLLFFMYDNEWLPLANAIRDTGKSVLIGQGKGRDSFIDACSRSGLRDLEILPFMNQNQWDLMMKSTSALFIRGEESLSRACLSGIPFVWQAYPQTEEYQLVKMEALLQAMKGFFDSEDFDFLYKLWMDFNLPSTERNEYNFENACKVFLEGLEAFEYGFRDFAVSLRKNGDLCSNLMTFIRKIDII
ncbi:MAG: elongation factor P maturation arginine rhamnosyltransferase EarP [Treponema sp.]|nr:elongation factor P maturation arginine rhamnosyltransferase EarP [Treponema sp.]